MERYTFTNFEVFHCGSLNFSQLSSLRETSQITYCKVVHFVSPFSGIWTSAWAAARSTTKPTERRWSRFRSQSEGKTSTSSKLGQSTLKNLILSRALNLSFLSCERRKYKSTLKNLLVSRLESRLLVNVEKCFFTNPNLTPTHRHVNDSIMELLIMCYGCKTSSSGKVIGVIPHMPYSRHSEYLNDKNVFHLYLQGCERYGNGDLDHRLRL